MKQFKEKRTYTRTVRFSNSELLKVEKEAAIYQMTPSTYMRDKILNGKERTNYNRRIMNTRMVEVTRAIDNMYDYLANVDSDYVPKTELIPLFDNVKKGCNALWKQ